MFGWISNIRVSAKLSLGFGLVLGLALLLAATGWYAVVTLTDRGLKVEEIAQISARLIVNQAAFKLKRVQIQPLLDALTKAVA